MEHSFSYSLIVGVGTSHRIHLCAVKGNESMKVLVAQLCLILRDAVDCSPPGFSIRILQTRILEWVAISSSREIMPTPWFKPRVSCISYIGRLVLDHWHHLGSP